MDHNPRYCEASREMNQDTAVSGRREAKRGPRGRSVYATPLVERRLHYHIAVAAGPIEFCVDSIDSSGSNCIRKLSSFLPYIIQTKRRKESSTESKSRVSRSRRNRIFHRACHAAALRVTRSVSTSDERSRCESPTRILDISATFRARALRLETSSFFVARRLGSTDIYTKN